MVEGVVANLRHRCLACLIECERIERVEHGVAATKQRLARTLFEDSLLAIAQAPLSLGSSPLESARRGALLDRTYRRRHDDVPSPSIMGSVVTSAA